MTKAHSGGPRVGYAGVLDGCTLWLLLEGLAEPSTTVRLDGEAGSWTAPLSCVEWLDVTDGAWCLSARLPLETLPGEGDAGFVLRLGQGAELVTPEMACSPAPAPPARTPMSPDGRWQFEVRLDVTGALELHRRIAPEVVPASRLEVSGDKLSVSCAAELPGAALLLLDKRQRVVWDGQRDPEAVAFRVFLDPDELPPDVGAPWRVAVGSAASWRPVGRDRNGLVKPDSAVALPVLRDSRSGLPLLRLSWSPRGWLTVVRPRRGKATSS